MNEFEVELEGHKIKTQILDESEIRPCGDCQACCSVIGVAELQKPGYTRCANQCAGGCAIYANRPASCQTYFCGYKAGWIEERPDKCGVIVDFQIYPLPGLFRIWEVRDGASETKRGKKLIRKLRERFGGYPIIVATKENQAGVASPDQMPQQITAEMDRLGTMMADHVVKHLAQ